MKITQMEWNDSKISKFWDYESSVNDDYFSKTAAKPIVKIIKKYFKKNFSVLDFGAGQGFLVKELCKYKDIKVSGLEFSQNSINILKTKQETLHFNLFSLNDILNHKFDMVTLIEVIEHLDDTKLQNTMETISKILCEKSGGGGI